MKSWHEAFHGLVGNVSRTRIWVNDLLVKEGVDPDACDVAMLVVSELATNAITHSYSGVAGGLFIVALDLEPTLIRISVKDIGGSTVPRPRSAQNHDTDDTWEYGGRGLHLVAHFATTWWATITHGECLVTAELPRNGATP